LVVGLEVKPGSTQSNHLHSQRGVFSEGFPDDVGMNNWLLAMTSVLLKLVPSAVSVECLATNDH
jgi:hypothetical protein